jgi:hypothetical protein
VIAVLNCDPGEAAPRLVWETSVSYPRRRLRGPVLRFLQRWQAFSRVNFCDFVEWALFWRRRRGSTAARAGLRSARDATWWNLAISGQRDLMACLFVPRVLGGKPPQVQPPEVEVHFLYSTSPPPRRCCQTLCHSAPGGEPPHRRQYHMFNKTLPR